MAPTSIKGLPTVFDDEDVDIPALLAKISHFISLAYHKLVVSHPYISGFILIMWSYYPRAPFQAIYFIIWALPKRMCVGILRCIGFGREGVEPGSYASRYQAHYYQDYIPEDSLFARYQSYGATGGEFHQRYNEDVTEPSPSPWWGLLGWALYFCGYGAMLAYGSLKGI